MRSLITACLFLAATLLGACGDSSDGPQTTTTSTRYAEVDLSRSDTNDEELGKVLETIPFLTKLDARFTKVTDAGMKLVAAKKDLKELNLFRTGIGDAGLKELEGLVNLETLLIGGTKVTDAGLASLAGMSNLQKLSVFDTAVTDAGLKHLEGHSKLRVLLWERSQITEAGARALQAKIPGLEFDE